MNKLSQPLIGNQSNYLFFIHKKHKQHDHSNTLWPNNLLHLRFLYQCNYAIDRRFPCQWAEIHHVAKEHSMSQRTNLPTLFLWTKRSRICDQTAMKGLEERQHHRPNERKKPHQLPSSLQARHQQSLLWKSVTKRIYSKESLYRHFSEPRIKNLR